MTLTSTDVTGPSVGSVRTTVPCRISQTSKPGASEIEEITVSPDEPTNTAALIAFGAPESSATAASGRSTSNRRSSFSWPPVISLVLHGAKQHVLTMCLCCRVAFSSPSRAFQILAEKSADAVAAKVAEASKAHDHTAPCKQQAQHSLSETGSKLLYCQSYVELLRCMRVATYCYYVHWPSHGNWRTVQ